MAGHHFHVHGAHDHEVEHQAHHEAGHKTHHGPGLAQQVAIFTAILSTIGAIVSFQTASTQNQAMLSKNEAVLKKTEASDQWNYYQAKSTKGNLAELASRLATSPDKVEFYKKEVERYNLEKKDIQKAAESLEAKAKDANEKSERLLHPHHNLELAMMFIQIAISLASITVLTRKRWLFAIAASGAVGGLTFWGLAFFSH
ncbi:MAG: DUF4337 domain-containing protein [Betaproteobacteria bacterium]|nr:DUF4337 domain-containing protein [Betaproteobacteria bacterium]